MSNLILAVEIDSTDPSHPGPGFPAQLSQYRNSGKTRLTAVEVSLKRGPAYRLSCLANLTYQKMELTESGTDALRFNSPKWLANAAVSWETVRERLWLSFRAGYISSRRSWDNSVVRGGTTADSNLRLANIFQGVDLNLAVKNIFDRERWVPLAGDYEPSTKIQGPGRSLLATIRMGIGH